MRRTATFPLVLAFAWIAAPVASAQSPSTDPGAGSPPGAIYQIPLDDGRGDAAPTHVPQPDANGGGGGGSATGATAGGSAPSPIRSTDNGFGSSSQVPGATSTQQSGATGATGATGAGGAKEQDVQAGGVVPQTRTAAAAAGTPSVTRSAVLVALAALVAAGIGLATRRARA